MSRARAAIAALVLPALVLVALAARSYQPFGGEGGGRRASSTTFFDSALTVMLVLGGLYALAAAWAWFQSVSGSVRRRRGNQPPYASLVAVFGSDRPDRGDRRTRTSFGTKARLGERGTPISCVLDRWSADIPRPIAHWRNPRFGWVACHGAGCPHRRGHRHRSAGRPPPRRPDPLTAEQLRELRRHSTRRSRISGAIPTRAAPSWPPTRAWSRR